MTIERRLKPPQAKDPRFVGDSFDSTVTLHDSDDILKPGEIVIAEGVEVEPVIPPIGEPTGLNWWSENDELFSEVDITFHVNLGRGIPDDPIFRAFRVSGDLDGRTVVWDVAWTPQVGAPNRGSIENHVVDGDRFGFVLGGTKNSSDGAIGAGVLTINAELFFDPEDESETPEEVGPITCTIIDDDLGGE